MPRLNSRCFQLDHRNVALLIATFRNKIRIPFEEDWRRNFDALEAFVETNGHARVHGDFVTDDGLKLGSWVSDQRKAYKKDELGSESRASLNKLGSIWKI
jgi:hypothetical protein